MSLFRRIRNWKMLAFLVSSAVVSLGWQVNAFAPHSTSRSASGNFVAFSTTALQAENGRKTERRQFFGLLRRIATIGAVITPALASAEQETLSGKIVEITISNLEGDPSKSGIVQLQLEPSWAPRGVARFMELTENQFFKDCRIFRVLPGFVAQFGIQGNPSIQAEWRSKSLLDDPVKVSNSRGTVVFATAGPNSRTTQLFINTADNSFLDKQGFSPIGKVISGMDVVDKFYAGYGEGAPRGPGPNQGMIQMRGNAYLESTYPKLSYISSIKFAE
jgi:peptidyl-prolyl cis-trans isomerase A (cyclophilin A)